MAPERLFHYTTPDGLIGIVRDNSLWATSAFYLNDSQELIGGIEIARKQLEAFKQSADMEQKNRIDWLLNDIRSVGTVRSKAAFVCSLSSEHDLLSQWRAYCCGGGFSIGFPVDQFREAIGAQDFSLNECIYVKTEQDKLIKETIELVALEWIRGAQVPVTEDVNRFKVSGKLIWELIRAASWLKNSSFKEEQEFRIVSLPERRYEVEKQHFRSRNGIIVPYTKIQLPETVDFWGKTRIVVGPTPHRDESKASVYDLVRRYRGQAVAIDITDTPFREW
jgi:hypothetical protein